MFARDKYLTLPEQDEALPGRDQPMPVPETHFVNGNPLKGPFAEILQQAVFAMGCFLGRRENLLANAGRVHHSRWLRRWPHTKS